MTKPFNKVLIANRGEIALRIHRALRTLSIPSVAIFHDVDRGSLVVQASDEAVEVTGDSPTEAYLDAPQIIAICQRCGVDAVHPGYGFLSENAAFARALESAGITFIGPSADAIELMGDKIISRNFVEKHGFPVPPSLKVDLEKSSQAEIQQAVADVGYPVVVKAAAGGGGKGMNIVHKPEALAESLRVAASEARKYFGDSRVYVERYFTRSRHIEVQVVGDGDNVIHLGVRECSLQRRFQKIIEESPSPALSEDKTREICEVAVGIATAANYTNAGTVEFLYTPEGEFFFLEMNTRIQVEHPVTELVFDVDLVAEQIRIASGSLMGEATKNRPEHSVLGTGHAIECRICAEDPDSDFMPEVGKVLFLREPSGPGIRFDSGIYQRQHIGSAFDSMLAKLVVYADTREAATAKAIEALQSLVILGVKTNCGYLQDLLRHPAFANGDFDTGFTQRYADERALQNPAEDEANALLATAWLADHTNQLLFDATPAIYSAIGHWRN